MKKPTQKKQDLNSNGAGLGLTISQKIVRGLSGRGISLQSEVGVGSKFTFYIKNRESNIQKQDIGKRGNQFNNIMLNWRSMSYITSQSQEYKSDISSIKGQSNKSQITPQQFSSPNSRGSMIQQVSREESDRKNLYNMFANRNSFIRKGSKFLEENLFYRDNSTTGLSTSLDPQHEIHYMNQGGERRQSKKNINQLFVTYDKPSFMQGSLEQEVESKRYVIDNKNLQLKSCDVIESFTDIDNNKNQVQAFKPHQGHSSMAYQEQNINKRAFNQFSSVSSSSVSLQNINNQQISQYNEKLKSTNIQGQNNNYSSIQDNVKYVNKDLRIQTVQPYNLSPNLSQIGLLNPVHEINDESVEFESNNQLYGSSHRKLIQKSKPQQSTSPLKSADKSVSIIDLDSAKNADGKEKTFVFLGTQQASTNFQDTTKIISAAQYTNQSISSEQIQQNKNNIDNKIHSFLSGNIDAERTPHNNSSKELRVNNVQNETLNKIQLSFDQQQLTEIKINDQQEKSTKNADANNVNLENGDMEKVVKQYSKEQLLTKQVQLKQKLQEYFANYKCKCNQVLIVDDIQFNVQVLKKLLSTYGIVADQAFNGKLALNLVVQKALPQNNNCCQHYKLIFMDLEMPEMNGFDAAQAILGHYKEKFKNVSPPIISACTAYVSNEDKSQAKKRGMKFFLGKPIENTVFQKKEND